MQKKFHTYLIMLTLGLFLLPNAIYACGTKAVKKCCSKEMSSETTPKKCCKDKSSQKEHKGCEGKCGNSNCTSASVISVFAIIDETKFNTNSFDFSTEKQTFYDSKTFISAGFSSLWLIPKIG
jgi:hypothetical protein